MRGAVAVQLLAKMTEFGKTPLISADELAALGYNIVIYPVASLRLAMRAVEDGFKTLAHDGTQIGLIDRMQTRSRLHEILRTGDYADFDENIFDFEL